MENIIQDLSHTPLQDRMMALVKNISLIYKNGYVASRGMQKYTIDTQYKANCLVHACFNFTQNQLFSLPLSRKHLWVEIPYDNNITKDYLDTLLGMVGLNIKECSSFEKNDKNSWIVAQYESLEDFHFLIKNSKDGSWNGKLGQTKKVKKYDKLPDYIDIPTSFNDYYGYVKTYRITNPCAMQNKDL